MAMDGRVHKYVRSGAPLRCLEENEVIKRIYRERERKYEVGQNRRRTDC